MSKDGHSLRFIESSQADLSDCDEVNLISPTTPADCHTLINTLGYVVEWAEEGWGGLWRTGEDWGGLRGAEEDWGGLRRRVQRVLPSLTDWLTYSWLWCDSRQKAYESEVPCSAISNYTLLLCLMFLCFSSFKNPNGDASAGISFQVQTTDCMLL